MPKIRVYTFKRSGSPYYQLKWIDPYTKEDVRRSTKTKVRRDAERQAAKIEQQFADGTYSEPQYTTWKEFRRRYEDEHLAGLADSTYIKALSTLHAVEEILNPKLLSEIDASAVSKFVHGLRKRKNRNGKNISESTIKSHLAHLKAAMNWANGTAEILDVVPPIPKIARAKKLSGKTPMKGRPITTEEFERMIKAVPKVVGNANAESWIFLIRGLWFSGLRLNECLNLYWHGDDEFRIDLTGKFPMFIIRDEGEKGHRDRILPMAPDFAELLESIPERKRKQRIFNPKPKAYQPSRDGSAPRRIHIHTASKTISNIGRTANVFVQSAKPASAQDLRRSFGERWSQRVMPTILQQMMRHESIETTMRYYVGKNADSIAQAIHDAQFGNKAGNKTTSDQIR